MFFLLFFATFGCAVAFNQYSISVSILPSLDTSKHQYYAGMKCPSNDKFFPIFEPLVNRFSTQEGDHADLCTEELSTDEECPEGFQIGISMLNGQKEDFTWQTWDAVWLKDIIKFGENNFIHKKVEFGVHFKLDISPKLNDSPNIVYRVNVYCVDNAGNGILEFKTFTKSETDVVFRSNYQTYDQIGAEYVPSSSVGKKCKNYQVKVWPSNEKRLSYIKEKQEVGNALLEPEFVASGVITNGKLYSNVEFPVYFNLIIEPSLDHEAESIYYVKVKCNGKESNTFKTFTHGNTKVVLNVKGCTKFDISVSKMDKEIESPEEISSIRAKMKRIGEKIKNESIYPIKYSEEQQLPQESEEDNDSLGDDDEKIEDEENMDDKDDDDLDRDIDEIIKQLAMEKDEELDDDEGDFEDSGDDVDEEDAPRAKKARAPPKTKTNKTTSMIAAKKGKKKVLESEDDDDDDLEVYGGGPVEKEDKPKPKKARAPPKTKPNKKIAAKKGKKKVSESEDDFEEDWDSGDDDWKAKASSSNTKSKKSGQIAKKTVVKGKTQIGDHVSAKESVMKVEQTINEAGDGSDDDDFERPIHKKMKSLYNFEGNLP
ncbi:hypothetical protein niasHT_030541 [Heterodera trifolii]|uniref:Uncharacterized protein n=1 Tax=Heterodera trifolii TaxID=157864 RepID=A0ABD2ITS7_9BILA